MSVPWKVGECYKDRIGDYEILSIDEDGWIKYRYLSNEKEAEGDIETKFTTYSTLVRDEINELSDRADVTVLQKLLTYLAGYEDEDLENLEGFYDREVLIDRILYEIMINDFSLPHEYGDEDLDEALSIVKDYFGSDEDDEDYY
jgi:hypothetical protein